VGFGTHRSRATGTALRADEEQDIIFAYQLHVIAHKGWRQKQVDISLYRPKSAFLSNEQDHARKEPLEALVVGQEEVCRYADDEGVKVNVGKASDGGEEFVCISFQDE
jgi:hypothetical protein